MTEGAIIPIDSIIAGLQRGATDRQYLGSLASKESRNLITRTYSITKEEAAAVDIVVGSPGTLYTSAHEFVRHAVFELLMSYEASGFPDHQVKDTMAHIRTMRAEAQRLQIRQDFSESLTIYEQSLSSGLDAGDYELVHDTLQVIEGYLDRTPDNYWRVQLKRTVLRSVVVKGAIDAFFEFARTHESYTDRARRWQDWLDSLVE